MRGSAITKYPISFPSAAMVLSPEELQAASRDAHDGVDEARGAGVRVFGGGIDDSIPPVRVDADGIVIEGCA